LAWSCHLRLGSTGGVISGFASLQKGLTRPLQKCRPLDWAFWIVPIAMNPSRYAAIERLFAQCPAELSRWASEPHDLGSLEAVPDCRKYAFPPLERIEFRRAFASPIRDSTWK
jgi:hypothetical protein